MSAGERILEKFQRRMAADAATARSGRMDLQLVDYQVHSADEAQILIQYNKNLGVPKTAQVHEWVASTFSGSLRLVPETPMNSTDLQAIRATVNRNHVRMPYQPTFVGKMLRVGADQFMDSREAVWEVREGDTGDKVLVRVSQDDLPTILGERLDKMKHGSMHHVPRLADFHMAGISNPDVGDQVEYYHPAYGRKFGKVTKVTADQIMVSAKGEVAAVPRGDLIAITKSSSQSQQERKADEKDFYGKAYGDQAFANKLVR